MAFLTIDETKCKQDGICAAECPRRIITQVDDKSFPQVAEADAAFCMTCGHCVAVCPHGALSVNGVDIEDCPEIERALVLSGEPCWPPQSWWHPWACQRDTPGSTQ